MTTPENKRLIIVEQRQKEMTVHIANLTKSLEANTKATITIQRTLDELTGVRKFIVWFLSFIAAIGVIAATVFEAIKDAHR